MKSIAAYIAGAILTFVCVAPICAQTSTTATSGNAADPALLAQLQQAANQDLAGARNGNKANMVYSRKAYEVQELIDRLKRGEKVNPSEIDAALEPVGAW